jgi:hypothetical protein
VYLENKVGRLILARPERLVDASAEMVRDTAARVAVLLTPVRARGERGVLCVDMRRSPVLHPSAAEAFADMMRRDNPHVERSGLLLSAENAVLVLQVVRLARASQHTGRRAFQDVDEIAAWLAEVLTPPERAQMRAFLAENPELLRD